MSWSGIYVKHYNSHWSPRLCFPTCKPHWQTTNSEPPHHPLQQLQLRIPTLVGSNWQSNSSPMVYCYISLYLSNLLKAYKGLELHIATTNATLSIASFLLTSWSFISEWIWIMPQICLLLWRENFFWAKRFTYTLKGSFSQQKISYRDSLPHDIVHWGHSTLVVA